ncbi:MAG: Holliday junction resolvase RuvX [Bacteroidetes bacterium 4484_276]|nr:MAG: Holliday junction resolvase RuvX [Bacteroidetes bacterium 4484_276]
MGRILAIDYGQKRAGLAVTDELRIIATGLDTVHIKDIFKYLVNYVKREKVDCFVVGKPVQLDNKPSGAQRFIEPFVKKLRKQFPKIPVDRYDERFTSKLAHDTMLEAGLKKKDRQNKALVDKISAVIILQSYLQSKSGFN